MVNIPSDEVVVEGRYQKWAIALVFIQDRTVGRFRDVYYQCAGDCGRLANSVLADEHSVAPEAPLHLCLSIHPPTPSIVSYAAYDFFGGVLILPFDTSGFCCVQIIKNRCTLAVFV